VSNYNKERLERGKKKSKERDSRSTSKLRLSYHQYNKKDFDKTNIKIPRKVINCSKSGSHASHKLSTSNHKQHNIKGPK
jgi:hypothetical protein